MQRPRSCCPAAPGSSGRRFPECDRRPHTPIRLIAPAPPSATPPRPTAPISSPRPQSPAQSIHGLQRGVIPRLYQQLAGRVMIRMGAYHQWTVLSQWKTGRSGRSSGDGQNPLRVWSYRLCRTSRWIVTVVYTRRMRVCRPRSSRRRVTYQRAAPCQPRPLHASPGTGATTTRPFLPSETLTYSQSITLHACDTGQSSLDCSDVINSVLERVCQWESGESQMYGAQCCHY